MFVYVYVCAYVKVCGSQSVGYLLRHCPSTVVFVFVRKILSLARA